MKKYVLILLSLYSIGSYATTHDASTDNGNNNNNLLVQLVDTKLSNMDDKLTRIEKTNQDAMADLKENLDTKLADKFKQLDDRAGDINFWFTLIGWIWAVFGVLIPLAGGWFLRKKVNDNIDKSKQELESFKQDLELFKQNAKSNIDGQLAYAEKILALIKENHSRSKRVADEMERAGLKLYYDKPISEIGSENKDSIAAISKVIKDVSENQLNAKDWFIRGLDAANQQEYYEAVTYFNKAIKLSVTDKSRSVSYSNRGTTKLKLGQYSEAIQDYDEAIKLNPQGVEFYYNRGLSKHNLQQYTDAIKDYDKVIELDSENVDAYFNKSCAYALQNDKAQALIWLDKALQLGYPVASIMQDSDWQHYHNDAEFKELINKYDKNNHANQS